MSKYIPGVCNIGQAEIDRRNFFGWLSLAAFFIFIIGIVTFHLPPFYRLIIFFPITSAATGFLQAYFHFCAAFGLSGLYNAIKPAGITETVDQKEFRRKDRQKSLQILFLAPLIGLVFTGIIYFL